MKDYLKRLVELSLAGGLVGAGQYAVTNGVHLDGMGLHALAMAAGMAAYGALVKGLGEKDRPTVK